MTSLNPTRIWLLALLAVFGMSPVADAAATPAAPTYCSAAASGYTVDTAIITIRWIDNSTDETAWVVEKSVDTGAYSVIPPPSATTTTATGGVVSVQWIAPTQAYNKVYHFRVRASNGTALSNYSNQATVGTWNLNGPINLTATAVPNDPFNVTLRWEENSVAEDGFAIERTVGSGAWEFLGTVGRDVLSLTANRIAPLGSYSFRVRAIKIGAPTTPGSGTAGVNVSIYSTTATLTAGSYTLSATKVPGLPIVNLSWPDLPSEDGYQILVKAAGDASYSILAEVAKNVTTYQATSTYFQPAKTYTFAVCPFKGTSATGIMGISSEPSVTTDAYTLTATMVTGQPVVNLSWLNLPTASGYQILIKKSTDASYSVLGEVAANVTTYQATTPTLVAATTYSFVVEAFSGTSANIICESSVASATLDGMTSLSGASGTPGSAFTHTFTHVSAAAVTSRSLTGTPSTLTFDSGSGILSGVLPAAGNYALHYTVNLSNSSILTQTFTLRVRPPAGPPVVGTLIPAWTGVAGASRDTPLAGTFTDAEAESAVRVSTTLGSMDFILFDTATPATVTNFKNYVNAGKYTDMTFHRSVAGFVIQGGGFKGAGTGSNFLSMLTYPPVTNEPGIANERGTISMAKLGGDPNSATSQFFVSLADNRSNLDYQNGGFTVFGRVAGNGMTVADAISHLPTSTYNLLLDGGATATPFSDFPMNAASAPNPMDQTMLTKINSVAAIPTLSYSITGNTRPDVATASIVNGQLHLVGLSGGQTTLTVTATDLDNLTTTQTVVVNLSNSYSAWVACNTFPGGQNAALQDPDGDGLTNLQEYAFFGDPSISSMAPLPTCGINGAAPAAQYLTLTFAVRKFATGLGYVVEANNQLDGTWTEVWKTADGFGTIQVLSALDQADRTVVTIKDNAAMPPQAQRFMRVKVVQD
ncbi:MAG: peptidylprolyl isomerase [Verrucomicrobiota bacterium]